jgi:hypothetical protein
VAGIDLANYHDRNGLVFGDVHCSNASTIVETTWGLWTNAHTAEIINMLRAYHSANLPVSTNRREGDEYCITDVNTAANPW